MTKVKICGITNVEDALLSAKLGADALGFNFYGKSPRYVTPSEVNDIVRKIDKLPRHIEMIGVFVNCSLDEINTIYQRTSIGSVQLHGDETPAFVAGLTAEGTRVIKALRPSQSFDPSSAQQYGSDELLLEFLLDTPSAGFGGSGKTFDWELAVKFKTVVPRFYLAGGLTPENVAKAVRTVRPYAVDVCGGVESTKGRKDPKKLEEFIKNAKNA